MALPEDREILEVAEHTEHVTFQRSTRKTGNGYDLPMLLHDRLAFSPEEYVRRYDLIQAAMAGKGLDALLIRGPENITYFTGYETPSYHRYHCVVVPKDGEPVFLVRDFEWINSPEFAWSTKLAKVYDWDHSPDVTANVLAQLGLSQGKRIGVEKKMVAVENTRSGIGKRSMILNDATPHMEVDPETYEVRADGELLTCEPATVLPMAQRYFLF